MSPSHKEVKRAGHGRSSLIFTEHGLLQDTIMLIWISANDLMPTASSTSVNLLTLLTGCYIRMMLIFFTVTFTSGPVAAACSTDVFLLQH